MILGNDYFYIKELIEFGRGLYAKENIPARTTIHVAEIILLSPQETKDADTYGILKNHRFAYSRFQDAVLLGFGSLFNGLPEGYNVDFSVVFYDYRPMVKFTTNRDILKDEQLFIQYTYDPEEDK